MGVMLHEHDKALLHEAELHEDLNDLGFRLVLEQLLNAEQCVVEEDVSLRLFVVFIVIVERDGCLINVVDQANCLEEASHALGLLLNMVSVFHGLVNLGLEALRALEDDAVEEGVDNFVNLAVLQLVEVG